MATTKQKKEKNIMNNIKKQKSHAALETQIMQRRSTDIIQQTLEKSNTSLQKGGKK